MAFHNERRCAGFLLGLALLTLFTGCSMFSRRNLPAEPPLELTATLDKDTYRLGEAVICTVTLKNASGSPIETPLPSSDTLECWYGPVGTDIRYKRAPVRSPKDTGLFPLTLQPAETATRQFVFTLVTEQKGDFAFHTFYNPGRPVDALGLRVLSPAILFRVEEPTLFVRDMKGVLLLKEAVRIVAEATKAPPEGAKARLIRNEAGFYDWLVEITVPHDGASAVKSFLVNPYTGAIRAEIQTP